MIFGGPGHIAVREGRLNGPRLRLAGVLKIGIRRLLRRGPTEMKAGFILSSGGGNYFGEEPCGHECQDDTENCHHGGSKSSRDTKAQEPQRQTGCGCGCPDLSASG